LCRSTRRGWGVPECLLGSYGSAAPCVRKRGPKLLNDLETYWSRNWDYPFGNRSSPLLTINYVVF
jgi:hypothetical protein